MMQSSICWDVVKRITPTMNWQVKNQSTERQKSQHTSLGTYQHHNKHVE